MNKHHLDWSSNQSKKESKNSASILELVQNLTREWAPVLKFKALDKCLILICSKLLDNSRIFATKLCKLRSPFIPIAWTTSMESIKKMMWSSRELFSSSLIHPWSTWSSLCGPWMDQRSFIEHGTLKSTFTIFLGAQSIRAYNKLIITRFQISSKSFLAIMVPSFSLPWVWSILQIFLAQVIVLWGEIRLSLKMKSFRAFQIAHQAT